MEQDSTKVERGASSKDVLAHLGISRALLDSLIYEGLPCDRGRGRRGNRYNLAEVSKWIKDTGRSLRNGGDRTSVYAQAKRGPGRPPKKLSELEEAHAEAKFRKDLAAAERAELALEQERGKLLDAEEVKEQQIARVAYARNVLLGVPARIGERVPEKHRAAVEDAVREEINAALEELAKGK